MKAATEQSKGWRVFRASILAACLTIYACLAIFTPPASWQALLGRSYSIALLAWAALAALQACARASDGRTRKTWLLVFVSLICWGVAGVWGLGEWRAGAAIPTQGGLGDFLRLAGHGAMAAGILYYVLSRPGRLGRAKDILDLGILCLGCGALIWMTFGQPILSAMPGNAPNPFWLMLFPTIDLFLLGSLLRYLLIRPRRPSSMLLGWLSLAVLSMLGSDLAARFLSVHQRLAGGTLLEMGWMLRSSAILAAAWTDRPEKTLRSSALGKRFLRRDLQGVLSGLATGCVLCLVVSQVLLSSAVDWVSLALGLMMGLLLVAREGVVAGQMEMHLFASLVTNAADMGFICRRDGHLLLANPAMTHLVGAQREPDEPHRLQHFLFETEGVERMLALGAREGWSGEIDFRVPGGDRVPIALSLSPVIDERRGGEALIAGTAHDLRATRRREMDLRSALEKLSDAQEELGKLNRGLEEKVEDRTRQLRRTVERLERLNEELKALDRMKSEFVTLVSHELRAPLANVVGGVELLLRGSRLDRPARDSLRLVQEEIQRLVDFVEKILDLSALEANRHSLEMTELDVPSLVERALAPFGSSEQGGRLRASIAAQIAPAWGDEQAILGVLHQLIDNAFKYARKGDVCVAARQEGGHILLSVTDHGPGIPEGERERIFEMFHRLNLADSQEVYGHGLGLYMARRLVGAMGGEITVQEGPGNGACFVVRLPAVGAAEHAEGAA